MPLSDSAMQFEPLGSIGSLDLEVLSPLVAGLRKTGRLEHAIAACKDMVAVEVKQSIRCVSMHMRMSMGWL